MNANQSGSQSWRWILGVGALLVLPWLVPWLQFLAYYLIWPIGFVSQGAYEGAWNWVGSFFITAYVLRILVLVALQAIQVLGLNIVPGFCGLLDLGYIAFYCVGAYTTGILMKTYGWSFWPALLVGTFLAALLGVARGYPTLRLSGDYYAIVTFGFAELVMITAQNWTSVTGGARGLPGIDAPVLPFTGLKFSEPWTIGPLTLEPPMQYYYLVVVLFLLVLAAVLRVRDSRIGRAWFAIREDEIAAEAMGVDLPLYKTMAFAMSAAIGGMAGGVFAGFDRNLHYSSFVFNESFMVLSAIVLGGLGSVRGVLYGTAILVVLTELLRPFGEWRWIVYGLMLIAVMRWRPAGLFPQSEEGGGEFALGKG